MGQFPIIWWELASHDANASAEFFKKVFGWDFIYDKETEIFDLKNDFPDAFKGGGIFTLKQAKLPFLTIYIKVDDIAKMRDKIVENGGCITIEPVEIFPKTWICLFNEPSGVTFAILEKR